MSYGGGYGGGGRDGGRGYSNGYDYSNAGYGSYSNSTSQYASYGYDDSSPLHGKGITVVLHGHPPSATFLFSDSTRSHSPEAAPLCLLLYVKHAVTYLLRQRRILPSSHITSFRHLLTVFLVADTAVAPTATLVVVVVVTAAVAMAVAVAAMVVAMEVTACRSSAKA